jgi:hypothetical protein
LIKVSIRHLPKLSAAIFRAVTRPVIFELAAITLIGLLYMGFFLSARPIGQRDLFLYGLSPDNRLSGLEHERLAGVLVPIQIGLGLAQESRGYDHIPTWNPYLGNGTPIINDAFNYLFNPFASLPVLIFGGVQGSKLAMLIALLLSGANMWALAKAIGVGGVARVAAGALYMMSGGIAAKFNTGHFQLGLSLAWPPLVLAGLWWTLNTQDRRAPILTAVAFALMFFAGNIYYTLHVLICATVIVLFYLFERENDRWHWRLDRLKRVGIAGLFALGLSMIQFMPVWAVRDFVDHEGVRISERTGQIDAQYEMSQAVINLIYPWENWRIFEDEPFLMNVVVDYAYIGPTVFLFIAGMVAARYHLCFRRTAWIALVLALLMMVWGAAQTPILNYLYINISLLAEFRYVGRAHSIAALWWIILAALGVDVLWRATRDALRISSEFDAYNRVRLVRVMAAAVIAWAYFFAYSTANFSTRLAMALNNPEFYEFLNQKILTTFPQAAEVLWFFILLAIASDTLLLIPVQFLRVVRRPIRRIFVMRILHFGLIILILTAFADEMQVNARLISFGPPVHNFGRLYPFTKTSYSRMPFASIFEPHSPSAFDGYYAQTRNWFLNEGWSPKTLISLIPPGTPEILYLPEWLIVSDEYGSTDFAQTTLRDKAHTLIYCVPKRPLPSGEDPCDLTAHDGAILYRLTDALPYTFVVPQVTLLRQADTITNETIYPAQVLSHEQDTIHIQATAPDDPTASPFYLIVQEVPFPGWQAFVDQVPAEPVPLGHYMGILMPPGTHTYTLRFQPPGFSTGLVITLITAIAIGFYLKSGYNK